MNLPIKKIAIPVAVVAVIGIIVYFVMKPSSTQTPALGGSGLSSTVTNTSVNPVVESNTSANTSANDSVLSLLKNMGDITLPTDVFSNNAFSLLSDGTVELPQRNDPGRRNPFSTLSGSGTATSIDPVVTDVSGDSQPLSASDDTILTSPSSTTPAQLDKINTLLKNTGIKKQN